MQRRPTNQDISWFLDLHANNQLELNPAYQRHSVWTLKDRKFFLDTILSGYPCPAVFLHKRMNEAGRAVYDVVDGKQRLETILQFSKNELTIDSKFPDTNVAGKKFRDLDEAYRHKFWNYVLPVEYLDFVSTEMTVVGEAFDRLNRNSRKLEPQELRHARFDGWFATLVEGEALEAFWRNMGVVTAARTKRMKDAQFIAELLLVIIEGDQAGFDQTRLDTMYAKYDEPDEEGVTLDTEAFAETLANTKQFLQDANAINSCVKSAASTVGAFYTLWSLAALHLADLPPANQFAVAYADFVGLAATIRKNQDPERQQNPLPLSHPSGRQDWVRLATDYANALQGAQTDERPRNIRLDAMLEALRLR
jgi:hypothetical protein